ncbi:MAG: hypothetical protein ISP45_02740 [Reyranella sp.]|nr:hypothetical protein [Reyranella sp.]
MIDWIGYGWMAGSVSGPDTYFADLTLEVPQGDAVAAAAVTGFSLGLEGGEPGSAAAYVREYGLFEDGTHAVRSLPPDPTNNVVQIPMCYWVRFRLTVFQGNAFAQGLVFRHAPAPPNKATIPKFRVRDYKIRIRGKDAGMHRVMALARGSVLREREILARAAAELAEFAGVRPRSIETMPAPRRVASPRIAHLVF